MATGIFGLVTLLGLQLLTPCLHIFNRDQVQSSLDESALVSSRSIISDVLPSTLGSITVNSQGFSCLSGANYAATNGLPMWTTFVVYYTDGNCLWRKTWSPAGVVPTQATARLTPAQLALAIHTTNGTEKSVAMNIANATFTLGTTLQVAATLQAPGESSSLSFQVSPRR